MQNEEFFGATYPIPPAVDARLRQRRLVVQQDSPLARVNQVELLHAGLVSGRPGYDYQNPNLFLTRTLILSNFEFDYSRTRAQTGGQVAANVAAGGGLFEVE